MKINNERLRQFIFLALLIGGAIILFTNWYNENKRNRHASTGASKELINFQE